MIGCREEGMLNMIILGYRRGNVLSMLLFFLPCLLQCVGFFLFNWKEMDISWQTLAIRVYFCVTIFIEQCPQLHGKPLHAHMGTSRPVCFLFFALIPCGPPWLQHLGMLCLPPSVPQLTCLPFLPVTRFFPDLCMGLVNARTKGQEYPRIPSQSFRGPCKTTSAAFCAKESLKGHQIAEEPHGEST